MSYSIAQLTNARNRAQEAGDLEAVQDLDARILAAQEQPQEMFSQDVMDALGSAESVLGASGDLITTEDVTSTAPKALTQQEARMGEMDAQRIPTARSTYAQTGYGAGMPQRDVDAELPTAEDLETPGVGGRIADATFGYVMDTEAFRGAHYATTATGRGNEIMRNVREVQQNGERKTHMSLGDGYELNGEFYPMTELQTESDKARGLVAQGSAINEVVTPDAIRNLDETSGIWDSFKAYGSNPAYLAGSMVRPVTGFAVASAVHPWLGGAISYDQATEDAMTSVMVERGLDPYSIDTAELLNNDPELHNEIMTEARIEGGIMATADMVSMKIAGKTLGKVKTPTATAPGSTWTGIGQRATGLVEGMARYTGAQVLAQPTVYGGATAIAGKDAVEIGQAMAGGIMQPAMTGPVAMSRNAGFDPVTGKLVLDTTPTADMKMDAETTKWADSFNALPVESQEATRQGIELLNQMSEQGASITPAVIKSVETSTGAQNLTGFMGGVQARADVISQKASTFGPVSNWLGKAEASVDATTTMTTATQALNADMLSEQAGLDALALDDSFSTEEVSALQSSYAIIAEARNKVISEDLAMSEFNKVLKTHNDLELSVLGEHGASPEAVSQVVAQQEARAQRVRVLSELTKAGIGKTQTTAQRQDDATSIALRFAPMALSGITGAVSPIVMALGQEVGAAGAKQMYTMGKKNATARLDLLNASVKKATESGQESFVSREGVEVAEQISDAIVAQTQALVTDPELYQRFVEDKGLLGDLATYAETDTDTGGITLPAEAIEAQRQELLESGDPQLVSLAEDPAFFNFLVSNSFKDWLTQPEQAVQLEAVRETAPEAYSAIVETPVEVVADVVEAPVEAPVVIEEAPVVPEVMDVPVVEEVVEAPIVEEAVMPTALPQTAPTRPSVKTSPAPSAVAPVVAPSALNVALQATDGLGVVKSDITSDSALLETNVAVPDRSVVEQSAVVTETVNEVATSIVPVGNRYNAVRFFPRSAEFTDINRAVKADVKAVANDEQAMTRVIASGIERMKPYNNQRLDEASGGYVDSKPVTQDLITTLGQSMLLEAHRDTLTDADGNVTGKNVGQMAMKAGWGATPEQAMETVWNVGARTLASIEKQGLAKRITQKEQYDALLAHREAIGDTTDVVLQDLFVLYEETEGSQAFEASNIANEARPTLMIDKPVDHVLIDGGKDSLGGYPDARALGRDTIKQGAREYKITQNPEQVKPLLDGLNAIQAEEHRISPLVGSVIELATEQGVTLDGMAKAAEGDSAMFTDQANRATASMFEEFVVDSPLHTPVSVDGTGRIKVDSTAGPYVYGNKLHKAAFEAHNPQVLDEAGMDSKRIYIAELLVDGADKTSHAERLATFNENEATVLNHGRDVNAYLADVASGEVTKDVAYFLEAQDYARMQDTGSNVTHRFVDIDATTSGKQVNALRTKDRQLAERSNVVKHPTQELGDGYTDGLNNLLQTATPQTLGLQEKYGFKFDRKMMKPPSMTIDYSATAVAMKGQLEAELAKRGKLDAMRADLGDTYNSVMEQTARDVYDAAKSVAGEGQTVMAVLQNVTKAYFDSFESGETIKPIINTLANGQQVAVGRKGRSEDIGEDTKRVRSELGGVEVDALMTIPNKGIHDESKTHTSVAPISVFGQDSGILFQLVPKLQERGISYRLIHDQVSIPPQHVVEARELINEIYADMLDTSTQTLIETIEQTVARLGSVEAVASETGFAVEFLKKILANDHSAFTLDPITREEVIASPYPFG